MFEILYHHQFGSERSHNSRHDCDTKSADGRVTRVRPHRAPAIMPTVPDTLLGLDKITGTYILDQNCLAVQNDV